MFTITYTSPEWRANEPLMLVAIPVPNTDQLYLHYGSYDFLLTQVLTAHCQGV